MGSQTDEQDINMSSPTAERSNEPVSLGLTRSPPRDTLRTSSPTQASQSSIDSVTELTHDYNADAMSTPRSANPTSSPNSVNNRYSPPGHLQYSSWHPKDDEEPMQRTNAENISKIRRSSEDHEQGPSLLPAGTSPGEGQFRAEHSRPQNPSRQKNLCLQPH
jgi:hypothetical protein